jgi:hypothetical protein
VAEDMFKTYVQESSQQKPAGSDCGVKKSRMMMLLTRHTLEQASISSVMEAGKIGMKIVDTTTRSWRRL